MSEAVVYRSPLFIHKLFFITTPNVLPEAVLRLNVLILEGALSLKTFLRCS